MSGVGKKGSREAQRRRMGQILSLLKQEYPESHCSLHFETPFQLLIATVLSAQCTDERVNQVTPALFQRFPDALSMSRASLEELEQLVRSTGFFRSKARALKCCSEQLVAEHQGQVPNDMEALTHLRGVGRKTANVVRGVAFGEPGLVVDTHVKRLTRRMGFTESQDPVQIEQEMMELVQKQDWSLFAHLMIDHGRAVCTARKPCCADCKVSPYCPKKP